MVHCLLRNCFVCRFGEQCVWNLPLPKPSSKPFTEPPEPSPPEHYQNFIGTWPPFPPQPGQNLPETSQHSAGEERALGKCVETGFEILYSWTKSAIWSVEVASRAVGMLSPGGHKLQDDIRSEGNGASDPGHLSPAGKVKNFKLYENIGYLKRCWNVPCLAEGLISQIAILKVYEGLARKPALHSSGSNLLNCIPEARVTVNLPLRWRKQRRKLMFATNNNKPNYFWGVR